MGKSTSCFKFITCGGDVVDKDDYEASEIKDSHDKRGWSFRDRSARHRVLSNNVITETPSSATKENYECANVNFQPPENSNVAEKIFTRQCSDEKPDNKPLPSSLANSQTYEQVVVTETETKADVNPSESVVIIVQSAIRGFLAQRDLVKLKNAVKLQAAVRGHLVRRHAVGTLRCVQAIIKMQLLVRSRYAQKLHQEKYFNQKQSKIDGLKTLGIGNQMTKSNETFTSTEKLLSNSFARQLLESTPRNKSIHVKCDPSKADSTWKWLERWMSISSTDTGELEKESSMMEQLDDSKASSSVSQLESVVQSEDLSEWVNPKATVRDSVLSSEDKEKLKTYDDDNFSFQASHHASSIGKDNIVQALPEEIITPGVKVTSVEIDPLQNTKLSSDASAPKDLDSLPQKPEIDSEQPKRSMKRLASDQLECEAKKCVYGSRKAINPAFIAAQSKFEELSSITNSGRSSCLSYQDEAVESRANVSSVGTDIELRTKEFFSSENSAPFTSRIGDSDCGTELSISSTLDSPDRSEIGAIENEREGKNLVEEGIRHPDSILKSDAETNVTSAIPALNEPNPVMGQAEIVDDTNDKMAHPVVAVDCKESAMKSEKNTPELEREQIEAVVQDFRSSPEASPRSDMTVPKSQGVGTPSSQVSVKPKDSKPDKTGSGNRRGSLSVGKKSPANANHDSGSRDSREQLSKDQQNGKRRNSFGSVKPDHIDQEPRYNSINNSSLPHFMQVTESARAKLNANNSPRSSPDVHDRDVQVKKRHSLPGATNRQSSPRITRSMPQAPQGSKGIGLHPPHERKWQR